MVTVLTEAIFRYVSEGSTVHSAMINVSKVFDQINHNVLSDGLRETSLPEQVIDTVCYMLNNTATIVVFNKKETES